MPAVTASAYSRAVRAVLVVLTTLGLVATGAAAAVPAGAAVSTHVGASSKLIDYNRYADVAIRVYDASGHALGDKRVRVYRHTATRNYWVTAVTTGSTSHVAHFRPRLKRSTTYLLVFPGTAYYGRSTTLKRVYVRSFGASLVHLGSSKKGSPYQFGASGPWRFDCSGFTMWVASRFGKNLAHSSSTQYGEVRHVAKSDKHVGDLVFMHDSSGHVYHVGFYAGNGKMLAATHTGDYVRVETIWTSSYYVGRLTP